MTNKLIMASPGNSPLADTQLLSNKEALFVAKASGKKQVTSQKAPAKPAPKPTQGKPAIDLGKELISWSIVPLLHQKRKGIIFGLSTLGFACLVWYASSLVYAVVAIVVSLGASASFALPTTYRLCENGVEMRNAASSTIRKWLVFKNYHLASDGVQLAYHQRNLRDKTSRGLFFYFGDVNQERVKGILADHIEKPDIQPKDALD